MQVLCGEPQVDSKTGRNVMGRPSGARKGGQPNRCARKSENRKRCAGVQPMVWSMCKARVTKLGAAWGAVKAARAAHKLSACFRKRRLQSWPRWYGIAGCAAARADAWRV